LFFIQQLCDLFEQHEYPSHCELPKTLHEIFAYRFFYDKIQEQLSLARTILEICLASRRPININVLYNCLIIQGDIQIEWTNFLQVIIENSFSMRNLKRFISFQILSYLSIFINQLSNSTYAIVHGSIRNWLLTNSNQYFACNIK